MKDNCQEICERKNLKSESTSFPRAGEELTLAELPIGITATIAKVRPNLRGSKKFADVGLVAGTELQMEAHAPFGGLLRVKILGTSMALHRNDAANFILVPNAM